MKPALSLCVLAVAGSLLAAHGSDMPIWGDVLSSQLGVEIGEGARLELNALHSTKVERAATTNAFFKPTGKWPGCSKSDPVQVKITSERTAIVIFPAQQLKAKIHLEPAGGEKMKAIVDWLGSLEAQE